MGVVQTSGSTGELADGSLRGDDGRGSRVPRNRGTDFNSGIVTGTGASGRSGGRSLPKRTGTRVGGVRTRGNEGERFGNEGFRADGGRGGRAFRSRGANFNSGMVA